MYVVGYVRVSTEDQGVRGISIDNQKARVKRHGATHIYQDIQSGQDLNRPGFSEMLKEARSGRVSEVICTSIDRLGRDGVVLLSIVYELHKQGVKWTFLDDHLDLDDPSGTILFFLKAGMSQSEVEKTKHRVKSNFKRLREKKLPLAGLPCGYVIDRTTRKACLDEIPFLCLVSDRPSDWEKHSAFYQELYSSNTEYYNFYTNEYVNWKSLKDDPRIQSTTIADLCRESVQVYIRLKIMRHVSKYMKEKYNLIGIRQGTKAPRRYLLPFNSTHFSCWIRNPVLYGHTHYNKACSKEDQKIFYKQKRIADFSSWSERYDIHFDTHPDQRLISKEQEIQLNLISPVKCEGKSQDSKLHQVALPLAKIFTGLVHCPLCGHTMTYRTSSIKSKHSYIFCRNTGCTNTTSIREDKLNQLVILEILNKVQTIGLEYHERPSKPLEILNLEEEISQINSALDLHPNNQILVRAKEESLSKLSKLENEYKCFDFSDKTAAEILSHPAMKNVGFLEFLSLEYRKVIYRNLFEYIFILNGNIHSIGYRI
ncbi:MAG: recombinase family protein [Calothrix sp. FI2-JRJ7]|jgi:DNA invertase Pin-like site-specific DNA recombinase|nr:recombinase family protein [Calothrix sp. FI2-JRJ7]